MSSCTCLESAERLLSLRKSLEIGAPHPGLPAPLPAGEHVVWQGLPHWHSLARQLYHTHLLAAYFALLAAWRVAAVLHDGRGVGDAVLAATLALGCGVVVIGLFELLAWLSARATIYTITNRRIVMRIGTALSKTVDIPFKAIDAVQLKVGANGIGNIPLELKRDAVIPYLIMWPHARPWRLRYPQPMLRALPEAKTVAEMLVRRLESEPRAESVGEDRPADEPPAQQDVPASVGAPSSAPANATATRPPRPAQAGDRVPIMAAAALVLLTLVAVAWVQLDKSTSERTAGRSAQTVYELSFSDLGNDRLAVVDTRLDETITVVEPGRDGLIRSALRGLGRVRDLRGLPADAPYQLVVWDTGRKTLSDLETDRHIPLDSFGPAENGALAALLQLK